MVEWNGNEEFFHTLKSYEYSPPQNRSILRRKRKFEQNENEENTLTKVHCDESNVGSKQQLEYIYSGRVNALYQLRWSKQ